ncbi:choline monooxygenase, chloroplastic-like [Aristolochia californica]|uniref:choline monooxygenase, chloroplastic-like n=1 Tax=Aristolochia californica TaxID=171875 RepID=UPI0035E34155
MATLKPNPLRTEILKFHRLKAPIRKLPSLPIFCRSTSVMSSDDRRMVEAFDPRIPVQEAVTPPSCWYTEPSFLDLELERIFYKGWQVIGYTEQMEKSMNFFTGRLGNVEFVVCRDAGGNLHAYHNVCRHRASLLASGSGRKSCFVCPYHGWTYGFDGSLQKATRVAGIKNFQVNEFGLVPINVSTWGPFVLINLDKDIPHQKDISSEAVANEWLGNSLQILGNIGLDSSLKHIHRREYPMQCNWKVYCDNFLEGDYHVPYAHKGLTTSLKLDSYSITNFDKVSVQTCETASVGGDDHYRLGSKALYSFVFPNFTISRYGSWLETNLVVPLSHRKCVVVFDYFLEASLKDDKSFIQRSLEESHKIQIEDMALCEAVQKGMESPAYCSGRYVPAVEEAVHRFHSWLHKNLIGK